eukprot:6197536-Pleurochrysis_carterae.AAC.8
MAPATSRAGPSSRRGVASVLPVLPWQVPATIIFQTLELEARARAFAILFHCLETILIAVRTIPNTQRTERA